jgi:hypothetical protein
MKVKEYINKIQTDNDELRQIIAAIIKQKGKPIELRKACLCFTSKNVKIIKENGHGKFIYHYEECGNVEFDNVDDLNDNITFDDLETT